MTLSITFFDKIKYKSTDFIKRNSDLFGAGVINLTDFPISYPGTPNMSVMIGAGVAWSDGYRIANDSNLVTLNFAAADPTNPRIDIIQIGYTANTDANGDTTGSAVLQVKAGVAAASPIEPGADPGFVKLYAVNIAANQTTVTAANVTDRRSLVPINATAEQISGIVPSSEKGAANGVATLDANGQVPAGQLGNVPAQDWTEITGKPASFPPSAHAASHASGGSDPITPASIGAVAADGSVAMTGPLTLPGDPTSNLEAVTKQYADTKLPLAGGTMTGGLTVPSLNTKNHNPNLLFNPTARLGLVGWTTIAGTYSAGSNIDGSYFFTTSNNTSVELDSESVPCAAGQVFTLSAEMYSSGVTAGAQNIDLEFFDSSGTSLGAPARVSAVNGQDWTKYSVTITVPTNAATFKVRLFGDGGFTSTNSAWRNVKVESYSTVTEFSDDSTFDTNKYNGLTPFAQTNVDNAFSVDQTIAGQYHFILATNGCPPNANRSVGAIGAYSDGIGVQGSTNNGADSNPVLNVLTNDAISLFKVQNGGNLFINGGYLRWNSTSGIFEFSSDGATWKGVGGVKSIQRGSATVTGASSGGAVSTGITIAAVSDVSKAAISFPNITDMGNYNGEISLQADLTSTTNLQITGTAYNYSTSAGISVTFEWQIVEYY